MYISENTFLGAVVAGVGHSSAEEAISATFINMENWRKGRVLGTAATIGTNGSVDWALYEATAAAGTSSQLISGKTAEHTDADDDTVQIINFDVGDMTEGYNYVGLSVTVSSNVEIIVAGLIELYEPRYAKATPTAT